MRKGRVEPKPRHHDADAVRPDDAHEMRPCGVEYRLLQRVAPLPKFGKTRGNDHGGARSAHTQLTDQ